MLQNQAKFNASRTKRCQISGISYIHDSQSLSRTCSFSKIRFLCCFEAHWFILLTQSIVYLTDWFISLNMSDFDHNYWRSGNLQCSNSTTPLSEKFHPSTIHMWTPKCKIKGVIGPPFTHCNTPLSHPRFQNNFTASPPVLMYKIQSIFLKIC